MESFLAGYGGCLLVASHDRAFMEGLDRLFVLRGDGVVRLFEGPYSEVASCPLFFPDMTLALPIAAIRLWLLQMAYHSFPVAFSTDNMTTNAAISSVTCARKHCLPLLDLNILFLRSTWRLYKRRMRPLQQSSKSSSRRRVLRDPTTAAMASRRACPAESPRGACVWGLGEHHVQTL